MFATPARPRGVFLARTALSLALVAGVAACSTSGTSADSNADTGAGGTVTLLTYDSYAISKETLQDFTDTTGLKVDIIRGGDAAQVVNRALLTQGNPEADVLFGVDNNLISRTLESGLFVPHKPVGADHLPESLVLDPEYRVTPIDVGDVCVNYDKAYFNDKDRRVPKTLDDLAGRDHRDQLVVEDPSASTPGLAFLLATVSAYGPDGFADYWRKLRDNGVRVENSWDKAYEQEFSGGSGQGDRPLVVSYGSSPPYEAQFADSGGSGKDSGKASAPTGVLLDTCYRQIEFAGQLANAANPSGAQQLIDFMVTKQYQADLPLENFVFPARPDVKLPKVFTDNAEIAEHPYSIPSDQVAAHRDEWVSTWTDVMQR